MYGIALSAAACLRAGTRADVVWLVEADGFAVEDWSEAVMFTPGGGRVGALAGGRFDSALEDMAGRWEAGRLVDVEIDDLGALIAGTAEGASARCLVVPADTLPAEVWDLAGARMPFCLVTTLDDDVVTSFDVYTKETIGEAGEAIEQRFAASSGSTMPDESGIVSVFNALPELVVVGRSPVVDAMTDIAATLGWKIQVVTDAGSANGVIAGLSRADKVVVAAHDLDLAGVLPAGLDLARPELFRRRVDEQHRAPFGLHQRRLGHGQGDLGLARRHVDLDAHLCHLAQLLPSFLTGGACAARSGGASTRRAAKERASARDKGA